MVTSCLSFEINGSVWKWWSVKLAVFWTLTLVEPKLTPPPSTISNYTVPVSILHFINPIKIYLAFKTMIWLFTFVIIGAGHFSSQSFPYPHSFLFEHQLHVYRDVFRDLHWLQSSASFEQSYTVTEDKFQYPVKYLMLSLLNLSNEEAGKKC